MNYEITYDTEMIIPISDNESKIIEMEDEYIVDKNSLKILEHSCEYFGSSFEGRKEGTKKILGITHKSPIIVEESRKIIFFPTNSPERKDCAWVNLEKIDKYYKIDKKTSSILFKCGKVVNLNISYGSLSNQILRATRLKYVLEERINKKEDNLI